MRHPENTTLNGFIFYHLYVDTKINKEVKVIKTAVPPVRQFGSSRKTKTHIHFKRGTYRGVSVAAPYAHWGPFHTCAGSCLKQEPPPIPTIPAVPKYAHIKLKTMQMP